jgi:Transcriptional regulator containing PAS, AAA-type ATPase, and DNA-binding domains
LNRTGARIDKNNISFLCVPIKLNEEILGVLSVDRIFDESISFEEDLRVLGVVSVLIAQAIKLYETLEKLIQEGKFREDLYFRLNVVPIFIPPLRERKEDIPVLVEHFLKRFNELYQKRVRLSPKTMEILLEYPFPGNIRELENLIERLVLLAEGEVIEPKDLPFEMFEGDVCKRVQDTQKPFREALQDLEKERILKALIECNFNQSKAARKLGFTRRQLSYRIEKYNLKAELLRRFS